MSESLNKAKEIVSEAIKADEAGELEKAVQLYQRSLEYFMVALRHEKNPKSKEILSQRVTGYLDRAEMLKKAISDKQTHTEKKQAAAATGGGASKEDKDKDKMSDALSGAIVKEKPNVKWDDVAGLEGAKEALKEAVILPAQFPQLFTGKRRPWKGILLYGPPGTGKSYLAKAVATEANSTFFSISSSDLVSKWQGESEKLVKTLFEMARDNIPAIIFIDEIDSLCGARGEGESESARRIKTEFLVQMQGVGNSHDGILVLGATNTPWSLDPAIRRRFEKRIYIPLPEADARAHMFKIHVGDTPNSLVDDDFKELGLMAEGYSGSDLSVTVREALMEPLRQCQSAKFFSKDSEGMYSPLSLDNDPPCPKCPLRLPSDKTKHAPETCSNCHNIRMTLYDVPKDMLRVPMVTAEHFRSAMKRSPPSVSPDELTRFEEWTKEFGQEGC